MPANLDTLRQLVEAKTGECVCRTRDYVNPTALAVDSNGEWVCKFCHGTGQVPDPAFAPLLEVVRVSCSDTGLGICPVQMGTSKEHKRCHGTGFVPRKWEGQRDGAY